jgi:hypothetical protein
MAPFTTMCVGTIVSKVATDNDGFADNHCVGRSLNVFLCKPGGICVCVYHLSGMTMRSVSAKVFSRFALSNSIINIATGFLLALLPVPLIWKLQIGLRTRISVVGIFSLGLFACTVGI